MEGFATPLNTTGMGTVDPLSTDGALCKPRNSGVKRKMKSLKQYIKYKNEITKRHSIRKIKN